MIGEGIGERWIALTVQKHIAWHEKNLRNGDSKMMTATLIRLTCTRHTIIAMFMTRHVAAHRSGVMAGHPIGLRRMLGSHSGALHRS
jgi:hypothetical protein